MGSKDKSGQLFDHLIERFKLKNDAALARFLDVSKPEISRIRHGNRPVVDSMILRIAEHHGISIRTIRDLISQ